MIDLPNQVWCADITYIPMRPGFPYLVAIIDWFSRKVLAWRLSNSMDADCCVDASKEALAKTWCAGDLQYRSGQPVHHWCLNRSADRSQGQGPHRPERPLDRQPDDGGLWCSLKYESVYLFAFERGSKAKAGIGKCLTCYNDERPHSTRSILTPNKAYENKIKATRLAA